MKKKLFDLIVEHLDEAAGDLRSLIKNYIDAYESSTISSSNAEEKEMETLKAAIVKLKGEDYFKHVEDLALHAGSGDYRTGWDLEDDEELDDLLDKVGFTAEELGVQGNYTSAYKKSKEAGGVKSDSPRVAANDSLRKLQRNLSQAINNATQEHNEQLKSLAGKQITFDGEYLGTGEKVQRKTGTIKSIEADTQGRYMVYLKGANEGKRGMYILSSAVIK